MARTNASKSLLSGMVHRVTMSTTLDNFAQVAYQWFSDRYGNIIKDVEISVVKLPSDDYNSLNVKLVFITPQADDALPQELVEAEADFDSEEEEGATECNLYGDSLCWVLGKMFGKPLDFNMVNGDIVYFLGEGTLMR